jgi:NADH-quinone oxidoreductase subunit C
MTFDSPGTTEGAPEVAVTENPGGIEEPAVTPDPARQDPFAREVIGVRRGMFGVSGTGDTSGYGRLIRTLSLPGSTPPPYGGYFDEVVAALAKALPDNAFAAAIEKIVVFRDELTLHVRREQLPVVARALRDDQDLRFELCLGVSGAHYPDDAGRELHALYHLLSITHNRRVRVEVSAPDADPHVPSLFSVYPTTDWHERETYDFFGIVFDGHPSLTRILMPDDWRGHPQRKDYPLGGIPVEYKGARIPPPDERRTYH